MDLISECQSKIGNIDFMTVLSRKTKINQEIQIPKILSGTEGDLWTL